MKNKKNEIAEDYAILQMVEERQKKDTGERFSHEYVLNLLKNKLDKQEKNV